MKESIKKGLGYVGKTLMKSGVDFLLSKAIDEMTN